MEQGKLHIRLNLDDSHKQLNNYEPLLSAIQRKIDKNVHLTILTYEDSKGECAVNNGVAPTDIIYVGEIGSGALSSPLCFMIINKQQGV